VDPTRADETRNEDEGIERTIDDRRKAWWIWALSAGIDEMGKREKYAALMESILSGHVKMLFAALPSSSF
jgi:hypothetical protein